MWNIHRYLDQSGAIAAFRTEEPGLNTYCKKAWRRGAVDSISHSPQQQKTRVRILPLHIRFFKKSYQCCYVCTIDLKCTVCYPAFVRWTWQKPRLREQRYVWYRCLLKLAGKSLWSNLNIWQRCIRGSRYFMFGHERHSGAVTFKS
jgi:hypothetical protein